jgi:uncharacterized protein (TIGR02266 family)
MTRILVVDDVKLFRHMEATVLGWRGYTIEQAASGTEALEKIRANPPDLVLLDFYMPGMNGNEVCSQIKSDPALAGLPIIMVTSSSRDEDIRRAVQAGCDDYHTKPRDDLVLIRKVENLLGSAGKRRYPRVPTSMQVSFEDFKGIFFEYSRDISRTGVFIEMAEPVEEGTRLRLSFSLPPPHDHPVLAYGRVVRVNPPKDGRPGGVGVSFIHVDKNSAKVIDALAASQPACDRESPGFFSRVSFKLEDSDPSQPPDPADPRLLNLNTECSDLHTCLDEVQRDHLRLSAMVAISEGLLAAQNPVEAMDAAAEVLANLLGAESYGIFLHDSDNSLLLAIRSCGLDTHLAEHMPLDGPILQALQQPEVQVPDPAWPLAEDGTCVLAAVGLPGHAKPLGVITIHSLFEQKRSLTPSDHHLMQLLARHTSRALLATTGGEARPGPKQIIQAMR